MFDLGIQELIVICVVALLVFGPKRLPELGRTIGKAVGQFRGAISGVRDEVEREIRLSETKLDIKELPAWKKKDDGPAAGAPGKEAADREKGTGEEARGRDA